MNTLIKAVLTSFLIPAVLTGCDSSDSVVIVPSPTSTPGQAEALFITGVPAELSAIYSSELGFNRYTKVTAPNGLPIHLIAQNELTNNQIVRCRSILQHYLTNFPGSTYGSDKSEVANKMALNGATLMLLNGQDDGTNPALELDGQTLFANEIQVEGGDWYIHQNYDNRDAAMEEILHLVHDYGIGVDQNPEFIGALPEYQSQIRMAQVDTQASGVWGQGDPAWIEELTAENSLSQEYLASVVDAYYGLWGAEQEYPETSMWDIYLPKDRAEMTTEDPQGLVLMEEFFHPYLTYNARISEHFSGTFHLRYHAQYPYTHHARYLKDITLTGSNDSHVVVNEMDNNITGNDGINSVIFSGDRCEYKITRTDTNTIVVKDMQTNRDGTNTLKDIETLKFSNIAVETATL